MTRLYVGFLSLLIAGCVCVVFAAPSTGVAPSLYSDCIARQVGDQLTVLIIENSLATASARTNTKGEYDAEASAGGTGALDFIPLLSGSGSTKSEHKGTGSNLATRNTYAQAYVARAWSRCCRTATCASKVRSPS
jgi:flagellar basal body L-ring protein FlgH